jgi:hypothetical protein
VHAWNDAREKAMIFWNLDSSQLYSRKNAVLTRDKNVSGDAKGKVENNRETCALLIDTSRVYHVPYTTCRKSKRHVSLRLGPEVLTSGCLFYGTIFGAPSNLTPHRTDQVPNRPSMRRPAFWL